MRLAAGYYWIKFVGAWRIVRVCDLSSNPVEPDTRFFFHGDDRAYELGAFDIDWSDARRIEQPE